jgi:hypothetical protein
MTKTFKLTSVENGVEFHEEILVKEIKAIADCEDDTLTVQYALLIHFTDDEFADGNGIIFGYDMPESDEDAKQMIDDAYYERCYFLDDDGIYHAGVCSEEEVSEWQEWWNKRNAR